MTLLEKAKEMGLDIYVGVNGEYGAACPYTNGLESAARSDAFCKELRGCVACYAREYIEPGKDSGEYWTRICAINAKQEAKGLEKYGQILEDNTTLSRVQRVEHAEEEAIDLLKYLEHLKVTFEDELSANDYQRMAMRTSGEYDSALAKIRNAVYGLNGEAGEIIDLLKKYEFQGHEFDHAKVVEELGDVLWYCALLADALDIKLQEVMLRNIEKLKERYPDGFDKARSINRKG